MISVVAYRWLSDRHTWRGALAVGIINPLLWLLAGCAGLGALTDDSTNWHAGPYLSFAGPGLLMITSAGSALSEAIWPVLNDFNWRNSFRAMALTQLTPTDICLGHVSWVALRLVFDTSAFVVALTLLGGASMPWAPVLIPLAVMNGMACCIPLLAAAAGVSGGTAIFTVFFRLAVLPMFLLSGTFFPLSVLPAVVQALALLLPLTHGVVAARMLASGDVDGAALLVHLFILFGWAGTAFVIAARRFGTRLAEG